MRFFFSRYTPILAEADASDNTPVLPVEPVLFNADSAGAAGGGGKRDVKSEAEGLPGQSPSSAPPAAETDQGPENAEAQPDLPADETDENPGLRAKNGHYFKSDTTPDTGIGNV